MDVRSDTGESQHAEVGQASKTNASVSRWSSDSKCDSSMVFSACSVVQEAGRRPSVLNDETCGVEASMRSSSSLLRTRSQTSRSSRSTWNIPSPPASPSLDSLPLIPDDAGAAFASKRLTTDTNDSTTAHYRHGIAIKSNASLPMCATMEAFAIELSPSAHLFADFTKTPVRG